MSQDTPAVRPVTPSWLFAGVLVLLALAPGQLTYALDPKHGPFIAYVDVLAAGVVGLWALWTLLTGRLREVVWPPRHTWALVGVAVLAGLGAESLKAAVIEIAQLTLYFILAYMLFCDVLREESRRRIALLVLLAFTSLAIGYAVWQTLNWQGELPGIKAAFQSRGAYSAFLVLVLPFFYGLVLHSRRLWERIWGAVAILAGMVTMVAPGLLLVLLAVLGLMTATWAQRPTRWLYGLALAAAGLVCLTLLPPTQKAFRELVNPYEEGPIYKTMDAGQTGDQPLVKKRWLEWMPALNMMSGHFLLGVGTGNYQLNIGLPEYYGFLPNVKKSEADTNNLYLVTGSSMGFAGLVALLGFMGYFVWRARSLWMHLETPEAWPWAAGVYGLVMAVPLVNLLASVFVRGTALVWALGYALVIVISGVKRAAEDQV